jgi:hypothetical protein
MSEVPKVPDVPVVSEVPEVPEVPEPDVRISIGNNNVIIPHKVIKDPNGQMKKKINEQSIRPGDESMTSVFVNIIHETIACLLPDSPIVCNFIKLLMKNVTSFECIRDSEGQICIMIFYDTNKEGFTLFKFF